MKPSNSYFSQNKNNDNYDLFEWWSEFDHIVDNMNGETITSENGN